MPVLYPRCAGWDVHKKVVVGCRMGTEDNGEVVKEMLSFGTTTAELLRRLDWRKAAGCTQVAMASTGEYWKPVYNLLEGPCEILLVNARQVKAVPGRKTEGKDAEWLADLLRQGLRRGSCIPPRPPRELRDWTRPRSHLVGERAAVVNRLQQVLEDAHLKRASVVTDGMGVSARALLQELIAGPANAGVLADWARGRRRRKRAEWEKALTGRIRDPQRFLLSQHLVHLDFLEEPIEPFEQALTAQIEGLPAPIPPTNAPTAPSEAAKGATETGPAQGSLS